MLKSVLNPGGFEEGQFPSVWRGTLFPSSGGVDAAGRRGGWLMNPLRLFQSLALTPTTPSGFACHPSNGGE
jgi:hypothetical protein